MPSGLSLEERLFQELLSLGLNKEPSTTEFKTLEHITIPELLVQMNLPQFTDRIETPEHGRVQKLIVQRKLPQVTTRIQTPEHVSVPESFVQRKPFQVQHLVEDNIGDWNENDPEDTEMFQIVVGPGDFGDDDNEQIEVVRINQDDNDQEENNHPGNNDGRKGMCYHNYDKCRDRVDKLYMEFANEPYKPIFSHKASLYNFPESVVRDWWHRFQRDSSWRPYDVHSSNNRRLFTNEQERSIADFIVENYIEKDIGLTLRQLRKILLIFFSEFFLNELDELENPDDVDYDSVRVMHGSRKFLFSFMRRNGLSFRKLRTLRRPAIDAGEVTDYQFAFQFVRSLSKCHVFVNADESNWLVVQPPKRIVASKGADSVHCLILGDPKAGFTFMGAICENGLKLPIYAIARGKTQVCHKQFGEKIGIIVRLTILFRVG
jgi:hypothetical protein